MGSSSSSSDICTGVISEEPSQALDLEAPLLEMRLSDPPISLPPVPNPPLSPASGNSNPRSVSAAVSNESVAGDSGVYEAIQSNAKPRLSLPELGAETAQLLVKLR